MNYSEAKQIAQTLWDESEKSGKILDGFPKGPMGLTPDGVRASQEWKVAKTKFDSDFSKLREFNAFFSKTFKKERMLERSARFAK